MILALLLWTSLPLLPCPSIPATVQEPPDAAPAAPAAPADKEAGDDEEEDEGPLSPSTFAGLELRSIGPALGSGRISDFAVHPRQRHRYFAATASGGVWRTENAGTTWEPVFDGEGSYSIGCVTLDPNDPHVVWVGTGENNSQRSVSWGDGVYKSLDGGGHWENVGLEESEHVATITVDPRDSDVVFVTAQGPLWRSGGDRGVYKTTDGGKTWRRVLHVDDDTGANELVMDPRDPDVLIASTYQRRRHVWTLIDGGPGSGIWKSTDGGETWREIERGLPEVDLGRIGLAQSPADPDVVYAIVEAAGDEGGFFRSTDRGESWEKRSDHMTTSPQYYNEIVCDPLDVDRVYALDTFLHVTEDGGKTFERVPNDDRHVDDHALWIDPEDPDYLLVGCDGGVYESFDRGAHWDFKDNLPISQFYRVSVDESEPFYWVYGGTQDNNTMGGPSRTTSRAGIANEDWFVTVGGDGYETVVDPTDPSILYSLWQYGGLVRHDRRSGEIVDIKPREAPGEAPLRWNWDSPLILSPHAHTRLYFAANRLYRSDDRGDSWTAVSPDLTRQIDRNALPVMGRVWGVDTVAKNASTSFYGNIVSLCESPLVEGLLYVGTDDGLVQVSGDGGGSWTRLESFPGVPDGTYVSSLEASLHDADTVFAAFDNHKQGDFRPYLLKSTDRGASWTSIAGDLPEDDVVYALAEDHVDPDLLFCGTEFGLYFTPDGGGRWIELTGGLPTIAVRDLAIQRRESDLVLGTFGRSFWVLDDYSPLRGLDEEVLSREAVLFPVKDALSYVERSRLGGRTGRGSQGASFFTAPNPPFGAAFTYHLAEKPLSRKERREEAEKELREAGRDVPYPTWDELRAEDRESEPRVWLTVRDESGEVVRRVEGERAKGMQRVAWDLRFPPSEPIELGDGEELAPWESPDRGPLVLPGTYAVTLELERDGAVTELAGPQTFDVVPLGLATLAAADREAAAAFQQKVARLWRAVRGALESAGELRTRIEHDRAAVLATPAADPALLAELEALESRLDDVLVELRGDDTVSARNEPTAPSIRERVGNVVDNQWTTTNAPTATEHDAYRHAGEAFAPVLAELHAVADALAALEGRLEQAGAPWTPGRLPEWSPE